jgi:hypothetical protein
MSHSAVSRLRPFAVPFILAIGIRSIAAWLSHGQPVVDVASFEHWAKQLDAGRNPYVDATNPANYPPLWVCACWASLVVSRWTSLSFDLVVKLLGSWCDAASVVPVGLLGRWLGGTETAGRAASFAYAVNPVAILIASFHGQNDPVLIGLILWSVCLISAAPLPRAAEAAALVLGVSLCIKPVGVLVLPLMLARVGGWGRRVWLLALVCVPMLLTSLPFLIKSPGALVESAGTYRGPPDFGYVGVYNAWMNLGHGSSGEPIVRGLPVWMRLVYVAVFGLVWWQFRRATLVEQVVAVILSLYLFYGALGAQYLMWVVPLAAARRDRHLPRVTLFAAVALIAFYQLNHPAILTGTPGVQWKTGIAIPQWTAILFIAQAALYLSWLQWMRDLIVDYEKRHPEQLTVGTLFRRLISGATQPTRSL